MTPGYKIVRTASSLHDLQITVNLNGADYEPVGGPFRSEETREWCQAMRLKGAATENGEVRLRETRQKK